MLRTGLGGPEPIFFPLTVSFIMIPYRNMGERLPTGAEMKQRQLYHQNPSQDGGQLSKAEKLEHTAEPAGRATGW